MDVIKYFLLMLLVTAMPAGVGMLYLYSQYVEERHRGEMLETFWKRYQNYIILGLAYMFIVSGLATSCEFNGDSHSTKSEFNQWTGEPNDKDPFNQFDDF